nr:hypothetical protein [Tanacetum cinerariifolium]
GATDSSLRVREAADDSHKGCFVSWPRQPHKGVFASSFQPRRGAFGWGCRQQPPYRECLFGAAKAAAT